MNIFQFIWEGLKIALEAIGTNRMRAFLTMLGVATGIFVITSILTLVNTLQVNLTQSIAALGNTTIFVHHFPWAQDGQDWHKFFNRPKVDYRDYSRLKQNLRRVEGISYEITANGQTIKAGRESASNMAIVGASYDVGKMHNFEFDWGRFFSEVEIQSGAPVCILGYNIAENVFPDQVALDKYIQVKNKRLKVVGVLSKKGDAIFPGMPSDDNRVFVPFRLMPRLFNMNSRAVDRVITIKAERREDLEYVENETIGIVRAARGLKPSIENNFAINKQEALMNRFDSLFGNLEIGGWVISIFSILIAAFSIGMIMYISVRERTNEIGIQKALGSTRSFILYQYIIEAILICVIGGLFGILMVFGLGAIAQYILQQFELEIVVSFSTLHIFTSIGLSAFIGLTAGFIPALIAARMDPVEAIRFS